MLNPSSAARAQGVQWTRPYLVELCDRIREALESWAGETNPDAPDLQQAAAAASQLAASLETLNAGGAAGLARSLERALEAIERPDAETATVLLESVAVLPDYLERLETGAPDVPEVLARFVDRTAAAAGLERVTGFVAGEPLDALNDDRPGEFRPLDMAEQRRAYQRALRDWLRDSADSDGLRRFTRTLQESDMLALRRLGRVAEAAFAGLAEGHLKPGSDLQSHLAAIDQVLSDLINDSGADRALDRADEISRSLLEELHRAEPGCAAIDSITASSGAASGASDDEIRRAESVLSGRNRELFTAMAEAARGELGQAKEALNEFLLGRNVDSDDVAAQADVLRSVSESFGMLGLDRLRERVEAQIGRLHELTSDPDNPALLEVARELLLVESELDEAVLYLGEAPESDLLEGDGKHLPKAEHRRVMRQVLHETLDDIGHAKHLLDQVHRGQGEADSIEQADRILRRVAGVLYMAGLDQAAALMDASADRIGQALSIDGPSDSSRLEGLAEAMVVVEFYLDSLTRLDDRGIDYLNDARDRLIELGYLEPGEIPEPEGDAAVEAVTERASEPETGDAKDDALPALDEDFRFDADEPESEPEPETASEADDSVADESLESFDFADLAAESEAESQTDEDQSSDDLAPTLEFDPSETLSFSDDETIDRASDEADEHERPPTIEFDGSDDFAAGEVEQPLDSESGDAEEADEDRNVEPAENFEAGEPVEAGSAFDGDDFDLMAIFLEEFDEELAKLQQRLPEWRERPSDSSLLTDIRRSFHTLKGSGRMAGADRVGEFAWQVEQVLNQTIDGQHRPENVVDPVGDAVDVLPGLRARLVGEPDALDDASLNALSQRLESLGEKVDLPELEGLDPTLVQLMIKEINDHLETIDRWIERCRSQGWPVDVDRDLIRSVHTIKGTLRLAPIKDEAESMQLIEEYLQELLDTDSSPDPASVGLLEELRLMLGKRLERLQRVAVSVEHFETADMGSEARRLISALHHDGEAAPEFSSSRGAAEPTEEVDQPASDVAFSESGRAESEVAESEQSEPEASELDEAEIDEAEPEAAELDEAEIDGAEPEAAELDEVESEETKPEETEPEETEPEAAELDEAEIDEAEPEAAELDEAEIDEAEPEAAELDEAEIDGAELEAAELDEAEIDEAEPEAAELDEAEIDEAEPEAAEFDEVEPEHTEPESAEFERAEREEDEPEAFEPEQTGAAPFEPVEIDSGVREVQWLSAESETDEAATDSFEIDYESLDSELLELFLDEARELLDHSDGLLQEWREKPDDRQLVTALQRDIHTVKGSARMAGLDPIGEVAHRLEDQLEQIAGGQRRVESGSIEVLEAGCDHLQAMVDAVGRKEPLPAQTEASAELSRLDAPEAAIDHPLPGAEPTDAAATQQAAPSGVGNIRLTADRVEELLNFAGEVSIFRSRIEQEIGAFRGNIGEVGQTVARLREQLRKLEQETEAQILSRYEREHGMPDSTFDPLELDRYSTIQQLSRALAESVSDLNSLTELMDDAGRQSETLLMQQARINTELQEGLMQARMVSFNTLAPRLRRVVRNAARDSGCKAELRVRLEGEGELDRNVLDRVTAPIEHILRNAVAHGIEAPAVRRENGKPEAGAITITIDREATELLIRVADDGAGLDLDRIRKRALDMGLLTPEQAEDRAELTQIIFRTGFSTVEEVSELAGRGVGMDVVSNEIRQIGGRISVDTEPGRGTRFTMRIPLSLAVMQAIFVEAGERLFAIPLQAVRGVARIQADEWREALDAGGIYRYAGSEYSLLELEPQLGFESLPFDGSSLSLLMIEAGDQRAAIRVAEIEGHREIVLKPVGPQISSIPGILGGSIMGDGQVVVILDVAPMIERALNEQRLPGMVAVESMTAEQEEAKRTPLVMVVDDSITMRRVTSRILEHHGLEVVTARDGLDAVDLLFERVPDLMLLDIEMPRMDGFELAQHVRDDSRLSDLPIMMITSRSGDKHREHARKLGVDRYLIKPYQEANMVRNVFEMLDMPVPGASESDDRE